MAQINVLPSSISEPWGTFNYEPIRSLKSSFRLLRIVGVDYNVRHRPFEDNLVSHIECALSEQTFENGAFFPYQAVSYVWGSTERSHSISVDGTELFVTSNLFDLLANLWRRDQDGWLWIDGICIDQDNVLERNHQVQQMGRIYAAADRVIFYLGDSTNDTDILMDWLHKLDQLTCLQWGPDWYRDSATRTTTDLLLQVPPEALHGFLSFNVRFAAAMDDLLTRPWFKRVWVIQEVGSAQDGLIQCGDKAVPCRVFLVALSLLAMRAIEIEGFRGQHLLSIMPTELRDTAFLGNDHGRNLLCLLQRFPYAEATCEEDRIYALLGLSGTDADEIEVNYTKSEAEIVGDTISHIYRGKGTKALRHLSDDIAMFLGAIQDLDYQVFNGMIRSRDSVGIEATLKDEQIRNHLLERFNRQLSRYNVTRLLSSTYEETPADRQIVGFVASNFTSRSAFVSYLMHHQKTRDLLWKHDAWGFPRSDCNVIINTKYRATMRSMFSFMPHTCLQRHFLTFMTGAAVSWQVTFWFSVRRRDATYDADAERYCAGIMWQDSQSYIGASHVGSSLIGALLRFDHSEGIAPSKRRLLKRAYGNTPTIRMKMNEMASENKLAFDAHFLQEARQKYEGDSFSLLSFLDADNPELWGLFEREMSKLAMSCNDTALINDTEIKDSWLALIVFPTRC